MGKVAFDRHRTGWKQGGARPHPSGASNKAKAQRPRDYLSPAVPLRSHRVKLQGEDESSPSGSARQITISRNKTPPWPPSAARNKANQPPRAVPPLRRGP